MCVWATMVVKCAPPPHCAMVGGIFVNGGGGLPHFHFRHGGTRGDDDETPVVWKGSTEDMEATDMGMHCQEGTGCVSFFFLLTPEVQRVLKTVLGKVGDSNI